MSYNEIYSSGVLAVQTVSSLVSNSSISNSSFLNLPNYSLNQSITSSSALAITDASVYSLTGYTLNPVDSGIYSYTLELDVQVGWAPNSNNLQFTLQTVVNSVTSNVPLTNMGFSFSTTQANESITYTPLVCSRLINLTITEPNTTLQLIQKNLAGNPLTTVTGSFINTQLQRIFSISP